MQTHRTIFVQFIASVNNNTNYTLQIQNNSSIIERIADVLSMTPAHILQRLDKTIFDEEMKWPRNTRNIENEITISIFKTFLQFSEEEQMTIQKFSHCSFFDKIVEYMTPKQRVETCKHIYKYIETIQNSINAAIEHPSNTQQKTKSTTITPEAERHTTLPTEEIPENIKTMPEKMRDIQNLIQTLKKHTATTTPTEDNTQAISTTIKQLQQKTITFLTCDEEDLFINTLYETLDIGKLDKIGAPITITNTLLRKKQDTKNTQAEHPKATPAKKIKVARATKEIHETEQKTEEERIREKKRERRNETTRIRRKNKTTNELKKYEKEPIVETKKEKEAREAAETKAKYQILSLIYDTPHKKELKEQYIKDNPGITKHALYPIIEAIHNYIYEESETEQKSEQSTDDQKQDKESINSQKNTQNTTEQEKKQISALTIAHNTVPAGQKQCIEFYKQASKLQASAQNTPAHEAHYLYRILYNTAAYALDNLVGSECIHQIVNSHLTQGNNPNKLSESMQGIFDLDQKIRDKENTGNKANYHPTPLETSSLSLIKLYMNHCSDQAKIEFLQESEISDPQTEDEAKKSITDVLEKIKKETKTVPFKLMQQAIKTRFVKIINNNKKNTIQDIFAYIKEAENCEKIALYKILSIKHLFTQHEHNQPKELYKYNKKFINNEKNTRAIERTIQALFANFIFLEPLRSPEQKNEDSKHPNTNTSHYVNQHKISTTQQIIKTIILSLMQAQGISYINIIELFNLTLKQHAQLIKKYPGKNSLKQITQLIQQKTYGDTAISLIIKRYEPIIQQIAQAQKTYFIDNETTISEEQSATIEAETTTTKTITEKIKHSQTPTNLQTATTHTPSSKQDQPWAQQLIATTQKTQQRKRRGKHLLDAEHETPHKKQYANTSPQKPPTPTTITETPYAQKTQQKKREYLLNTEHEAPHKKQYENTSQQNPPTLIIETTIAQQNKVAHSQR